LKALAIVALTLLAYWPSFRGPFLWDDNAYITHNRLVTQPGHLSRIWFSTEPADYYPVTFTAFRWQWLAWGGNPIGYRVINALLHALNAILLWQIVRRLEIRGGWLVAALFAVHPVNVATVAWITELKNLLSFGFAAITVLAWLRFDETRLKNWYALALAAFVLALLSKSAVAPLPVVLLGLTWWRRGRWNFRPSLPFFGVAVVLGLVTIWFQHHRLLDDIPVRHENFMTRLATAGSATWFYLGKIILPVNLNLVYPRFPVTYWPGIALVLCLAWSCRHRALLVAFGGFVVLMFPMLGFVDQGFYAYSLVSDHWQYVALPLVIALLVGVMPDRLQRIGGATILATLFFLTLSRATLYADAETLWRDTLAKNPAAWVAHYNLGLALRDRDDLVGAEQEYRAALQLNPNYFEARNNLGNLLIRRGQLDEAMDQFRAAIGINPRVAVAHNNLGTVYARQGRYDEAGACFREALRLDPNYADARNNMARAAAELRE